MIRILLISLLALACQPQTKVEEKVSAEYSSADSILIVQKLEEFQHQNKLSIIDIAQTFEGVPYGSKTLDMDTIEQVVVNTSKFDCTTYIETCLALNETAQLHSNSLNQFVNELQLIRYRNGELFNYASRLHYFTEWILDQEKKGILKNVTSNFGGETRNLEINFMSSHINAYPQLKNNHN